MIQKMVAKIIDNIQIKLTNIYIRVEDELSIPKQPFALGMVIGSFTAQTMNDSWEPQFVGDAEITNKQF